MERFISKRNQVFLLDGVVVKQLPSSQHAKAESGLLRKYHKAGVPVPKVLEQRDNEIVMEHISGETIPDFLTRMQAEMDDASLHKAAQGLCRWFEHFYEAVDHAQSGEIRGDVNGRNFIITKDRVLSVDFEERSFGTAEQDIGRFLAFIQTYDLRAGGFYRRYMGRHVKRRFGALFYHGIVKRLRLSKTEIVRQCWLERKAMRKRRSNCRPLI